MKRTILFLALLAGATLCAHTIKAQGIMTTIAGYDTTGGYSGDGGPATDAKLSFPSFICLDKASNLYFVDQGNNVIRKIDAVTGIINTIAGNGTSVHAGDNGPATSAALNSPYGMCMDTSGNIYISEVTGSTIRKVDATTGIITTIAGLNEMFGYSGDNGAATNAELNEPQGIRMDAAGNLYIADAMNNVIRKVTASTGIISTVAGNYALNTSTDSSINVGGYTGDGGPATSAQLYTPCDICFDNSGNMYIADYSNHVVRMVNAITGIVSTFAGNGINAYSGDGGQATAAEMMDPIAVNIDNEGNIYIGDQSCMIRKVDAASRIISTVAGTDSTGYTGSEGLATAVELNVPSGICMDINNNIYIADAGNNMIRKATQTPTQVNNIPTTGTISIFPNPTTGKFTVHSNGLQNNVPVAVYNTLGEKVYQTTLTATQTDIDLGSQPAGVYYVMLKGESGEKVRKFIKE